MSNIFKFEEGKCHSHLNLNLSDSNLYLRREFIIFLISDTWYFYFFSSIYEKICTRKQENKKRTIKTDLHNCMRQEWLLPKMANRLNSTWHDTCPYNSAWREYVLIEHTARHDIHVGWVGLRILSTWTLKVRHD